MSPLRERPDRALPAARERRRQCSRRRRDRLREIKQRAGCVDCGYDAHPEALDFDHRDEKTKCFRIAQSVSVAWTKVLAEIEKCDVRCANCHRIRTARRREDRLRGDSPDSPPAGETGVPGPVGSESGPLEIADRDTRIDWPVIPAGYEYMTLGPALVSFDLEHWYEVPEGTTVSEFLAEFERNKGEVPS